MIATIKERPWIDTNELELRSRPHLEFPTCIFTSQTNFCVYTISEYPTRRFLILPSDQGAKIEEYQTRYEYAREIVEVSSLLPLAFIMSAHSLYVCVYSVGVDRWAMSIVEAENRHQLRHWLIQMIAKWQALVPKSIRALVHNLDLGWCLDLQEYINFTRFNTSTHFVNLDTLLRQVMAENSIKNSDELYSHKNSLVGKISEYFGRIIQTNGFN